MLLDIQRAGFERTKKSITCLLLLSRSSLHSQTHTQRHNGRHCDDGLFGTSSIFFFRKQMSSVDTRHESSLNEEHNEWNPPQELRGMLSGSANGAGCLAIMSLFAQFVPAMECILAEQFAHYFLKKIHQVVLRPETWHPPGSLFMCSGKTEMKLCHTKKNHGSLCEGKRK